MLRIGQHDKVVKRRSPDELAGQILSKLSEPKQTLTGSVPSEGDSIELL